MTRTAGICLGPFWGIYAALSLRRNKLATKMYCQTDRGWLKSGGDFSEGIKADGDDVPSLDHRRILTKY